MKYLLVLLCLLMSSCATTHMALNRVEAIKPALDTNEVSAWLALTGKWYGSQLNTDGTTYEWLVSRTEEGVFKLESKMGGREKYVELGEWGVSGPIYFVTAKGWLENGEFNAADPTDPYLRHAYEILLLNDSEFKYKALSDGSVFSMKKVADDYQLEL